jgi:trk system potassium uptake protein TrkA
MKIIICGAGQVGTSIARQLSQEGNEVTIIDKDANLISQACESMEVRAISGFASHPEVLMRAEAKDADMLIAVTYSDEVNMIACEVAHSIFGVPKRIARIRSQEYLDKEWSNLFSLSGIPIDITISPEIEVAKAVVNRLHVPGAIDTLPMENGLVRLIGVHVTGQSTVLGLKLDDIQSRLAPLNTALLAVMRGDRLILGNESHILNVGDDVYFACDSRSMTKAMSIFGHNEREARRLILVGGGNVGMFIAEQLEAEEHPVKMKILEMDRQRAEYIATRLNRTTVIHGSGLDQEILSEANVSGCETIIAVTNDDKVNILTSLLAKRYGAERAMALVNNLYLDPLISSLGIDVVVNPREITISTILQYIRRGLILSVHSLRNGVCEVLEAEAASASRLSGASMGNLDLPAGIIIGLVIRDGKVFCPVPETVFEAGDRFVILCRSKLVKEVEELFAVTEGFY